MDVSVYLQVVVLALVSGWGHCQTTLKAEVNMAGMKGSVTFTQNTVDQDTGITYADIDGAATFEIRQFWTDLTVEDKCADAVIGSRVNANIGGPLSSASSIPGNVLSDLKSLMGRSLLLVQSGKKACGTLKISTKEYTTVFTRFEDTITGTMWFRQAKDERTEAVVDLTQPTSSTAQQYNWKIYTGSGDQCKTFTTIYNPTTPGSGTCGTSNHAACAVGDLSGKLGQLTVERTSTNRALYTDLNLPLSGNDTIVGTYIVILQPSTGNVVSCAKLFTLESKNAGAQFTRDGVRGPIMLEQSSPFDPTKLSVQLVGLADKARGYHVHEFPVPYQISADQDMCSPSSVGGHWNPYKKPYPQNNGVTHDDYEIGDISGKFGLLSGADAFVTYTDYNLPMFGPNSVVGRSIVIHDKATNAPRWVCATLEDYAHRQNAFVTFKHSVIGHVILSQIENSPFSDTWIYVELNYADGTGETTGHKLRIHDKMINDESCSAAGPVFNPTGMSDSDCPKTDQYQCRVGDLDRQMDLVKIRSSGTWAKFFGTVTNIPLSGPNSVIGRSLAVNTKNNGPAILACGNIHIMRSREAIMNTWSSTTTGYLSFSQNHAIIAGWTKTKGSFGNLEGIASRYHVHKFPAAEGDSSPCSDANVSGHYNPFGVDPDNSPEPGKGSFDLYEVGDLSGKYGFLDNKTDVSVDTEDNMLNLFGPRSIVGRSVVIHKKVKNARWSCGTVVEDTSKTSGFMRSAEAVIDESNLSGKVVMTQYTYSDGTMSDTSVFVNLAYKDGSTATTGHKIHVSKMNSLGKTKDERCAGLVEKFNPFMVSMTNGYDECSELNPLRCAVGDLSGKTGIIGIPKSFFTDVSLPLAGKYTVIGRGLMISAAGSTTPMACSSIRPIGSEHTTVMLDKTFEKMTPFEIANSFAKTLSTDEGNVIVYGSSKGDCIRAEIHFVGKDAVTLKSTFTTMVANGKIKGIAKDATCAADTAKISLIALTLILLFKLMF